MAKQFKKATKEQCKLRMALVGPSGSGKTYSALRIASSLGKKIAVIDTERKSASKYASDFDFDVTDLEVFAPSEYVDAIQTAEECGYDVVVIDSLSHAWVGKGGALDQVDNIAKRSQSNNTYFAWRDVTPQHNELVDTMLQSKCHIIATMRTKTEYIIEEVRGKKVPKKIGLAPVQKSDCEYEFDVVADMDLENNFIVSKTRCKALNKFVCKQPGENVAAILLNWLTDGAPAVEDKPAPEFKKPEQPEKKQGCTPQQFEDTILRWDAAFVETGMAEPGQFIAFVREAGLSEGFPDDLQHWPPESYSMTKKLYSEFETQMKSQPV